MNLKDIIREFENQNSEFHSTIIGKDDAMIDGLNLCDRKSSYYNVLSFAVSNKYRDDVNKSKYIKALIVKPENKNDYFDILQKRDGVIICTDEPEYYFYRLHEFLYLTTDFYNKYDFESIIGNDCNIDKTAVIERGVIIGNNVTIGASTVIKHGTIIEDDVSIGCNSTIGSEGFQLIADKKRPPMHVVHAGGCHISKNVYIGDNTCICNSLFEGTTFIGENVKIDNLVYVAHNLYIGNNAVITAQVVLCGSSIVEEGAWIAPNVSVINKVTIGKCSKVGLGSVVTKDVSPYTVVYGNPAKEHNSKKYKAL